MTRKYLTTLFCSLVGLVLPARAGLLDGQIVQTTYFRGISPDMTIAIGPVESLVGPGTELVNFADFVDISTFPT